MTGSKNPGALGASGASACEMLGGNRTKNTKPTGHQQARAELGLTRATRAHIRILEQCEAP